MSHSVVATPLHRTFKMAVWAGVESSVKLHIERGDSLEARDEHGQTPLMLAAARNKSHICKLLFDAGANPLATDPKGRLAMDCALEAKAIDAARVLGWSDVAVAPPKAPDDSPAAPASRCCSRTVAHARKTSYFTGTPASKRANWLLLTRSCLSSARRYARPSAAFTTRRQAFAIQ